MRRVELDKITKKFGDELLLSIFCFLAMFIFYTRIRPLMICDADDWTYISYIRNAWPLWGNWNPCKLFPEVLEGTVGYLGVILINYFIGDFQESIKIIYAILISIFIALYMVEFNIFIKTVFKLDQTKQIFVVIYFFCWHFLFLKTQATKNNFMFTASNLNCMVNYLVPMLLSACLAMRLLKNRYCGYKNGYLFKNHGMTILVLYFAVFSNMVTNIIFLAPIIVFALLDLKKIKINQMKIYEVLRTYYIYIYILILELINLIFEANGGRANNLAFNFDSAVIEMKKDLKTIFSSMINKKYAFICIAILIISLIISFKFRNIKELSDKKIFSLCFIIICSGSIVGIYTIMLMARMGFNKILRCENLFVLFFYVGLYISFMVAYIVMRVEIIQCFLPLLEVILLVNVCVGGGVQTYKTAMSGYRGNSDVAYAINKWYINQLKEADDQGITEIDLYMPQDSVWPAGFEKRIPTTLYQFGIIHNNITVHFVADSNVTQYNINTIPCR